MNIDKHLKSVKKLNEAVNPLDHLYEYMDSIIEPVWQNLKIGKWTMDRDQMSGGMGWEHPDTEIMIYATPFWEGAKGIPFDGSDASGNYKSYSVVPMTITGDPKKDLAKYMTICKNVLSKAKVPMN